MHLIKKIGCFMLFRIKLLLKLCFYRYENQNFIFNVSKN